MNNSDFDQVYVLCVDKRIENIDRLKKSIISHLDSITKYCIVGKGQLLAPETYFQIDPPQPSSYWLSGPFSNLHNSYYAFLAFQKIIHKAKAAGYRKILILEDDVEFVENINSVYLTAIFEQTRLGIDPDILYLGANHSWSPTKEISPHLLKLYGSVCWHSVILKETVYDAILDLDPIVPIDLMVAQQLHPNFGCYAIWPSIAIQKPGYSNVEGRERNYSEFWKCKGNPAL